MLAKFTAVSALCLLLTACQATQPSEEKILLEALGERIDELDAAVRASDEGIDDLSRERAAASERILQSIEAANASLEALPELIEEACDRPTTVVTECDDRQEITTILVQDDKLVVGALERVWIDPPGVMLVARVDTGASSNSLHAENLRPFERDGDDWVRFEISTEAGPVEVEREIQRFVRVLQQADPDGTRRPVVHMHVGMGPHEGVFEFTLADRSHLEYELLLGRNFLRDIAVVDVSRRFVQPRPDPDEFSE